MRSLILAVPLLLVAPGVAGAAPTPGDYGGGGFDAGGKPTWMWARLAPEGQVRVGGRTQLGCGLGSFDGQTALAAGGSFRFSRTRWTREAGHVVRAIVTVAGRFDGALGTGTLRARVRDRLPNGGVQRCRTPHARMWKVHLRPGAGAPGAPQPGGGYLGLTSQAMGTPKPFVLGVNRRATRVGVAIFEYVRQCGRAGWQRALNNVTPGGRIGAGGTFALGERFTLRYRGGIRERFRLRIDGQFTAGGVAGSLRVSTVVQRRGRTIDTCDTGALTFSALL